MREAIAKPHLPMAFLGQIEKRESQFPPVKLQVLIKDDRYVSFEEFNGLECNETISKQDTVRNTEPV